MISLLLSPILSYGQLSRPTDEHFNRSGVSKLVFADGLTQTIDLANADINRGTRFLLLKSEISPVAFPNDTKFQGDYKIYYQESGCTGPSEQLAIAYNSVMFKYLTQTYGKKWLKTVRKDVLGLKGYK